MKQYLDLLKDVRINGRVRKDRTGTGTLSVFGRQLRVDMQKEGFPLLTTKAVYFKAVAYELLWFLSGETNMKLLKDNNIHIWDGWADENGELGRIYGVQWRRWKAPNGSSVDQLKQAIAQIKNNPYSRRIVVSAWNAGELDQMSLPPCHTQYQFYVDPVAKTISCHFYMRSVDMFLGLPFDIASYALLTYIVAHLTGLTPKELIVSTGDTHIYLNHLTQVHMQLAREPLPLPALEISPNVQDIDNIKYEDIKLINYNNLGTIKAPISI